MGIALGLEFRLELQHCRMNYFKTSGYNLLFLIEARYKVACRWAAFLRRSHSWYFLRGRSTRSRRPIIQRCSRASRLRLPCGCQGIQIHSYLCSPYFHRGLVDGWSGSFKPRPCVPCSEPRIQFGSCRIQRLAMTQEVCRQRCRELLLLLLKAETPQDSLEAVSA